MNWNRTILALGAAATLLLNAADAALERIEEAYEVGLDRVTLPGYEGDQVSFSPCASCENVSMPVDAGTRYLIGDGDENVTLKTFRETAAAIGNTGDSIVYVIFDTNSLVVTRLILDAPGR